MKAKEDKLKGYINNILLLFYKIIFKKFLNFQVYSYLAIGIFNTVYNILIFHILYYHILPENHSGSFLSIPKHTLALIIAFCLTAPLGFYLMRNFTFTQGNQTASVQFIKYIYVLLQGLILEFLIVYVMVEFMHMEKIIPSGVTISKICASAIVATINFFLQRYFTFSRKTN